MKKAIDKLPGYTQEFYKRVTLIYERYAVLCKIIKEFENLTSRDKRSQKMLYVNLKNMAYESIILNITALLHDDSEGNPTMRNLLGFLREGSVIDYLEKKNVVTELDEFEREFFRGQDLEKIKKEFSEKQINSFRSKYLQLISKLDKTLNDKVFRKLKCVRDTNIAHIDLYEKGKGIKEFQTPEFSIPLEDVSKAVQILRECMDELLMIVRNTSFSWQSLERILEDNINSKTIFQPVAGGDATR